MPVFRYIPVSSRLTNLHIVRTNIKYFNNAANEASDCFKIWSTNTPRTIYQQHNICFRSGFAFQTCHTNQNKIVLVASNCSSHAAYYGLLGNIIGPYACESTGSFLPMYCLEEQPPRMEAPSTNRGNISFMQGILP